MRDLPSLNTLYQVTSC